MRELVARNSSAILLKIPALLTLGETAEALRVSKPTIVRMVRRGELQVYRPNDLDRGIVLVIGDSVAEHVARHTFGGRA